MPVFVLHVETGKEEDVKKVIRLQNEELDIHFPKRTILERRAGVVRQKKQPVYPGYLFLEIDTLDEDLKRSIIKMERVFRFLPENSNIQEMDGDDIRFLRQLISSGKTGDDISLVDFDENDRIKVIEGPLKGREGQIVKVDRRKRRVRVQLSLFKKLSFVDFSVKYVSKK